MVALLVILEFGVDGAGVDALAVLGLIFDRGEQAVILALHLILAHVEDGRAILVIGADFAIVGQLLAAIVGRAQHDAETIVRPAGADRPLALVLAAQFQEAIAKIALQVEALLLHRRIGAQVDIGDDGFGLKVGRQRLVHRHRVEAIGARGAAFIDADHRDAVDADRGPAIGRAAHLDIAFLALVALHRDGRQARQGGGAVLVGEAAHRVGGDDVDQIVGLALELDRGGLRFGNGAGDDDLVLIARILGGRDRGLLRVDGAGRGERQQRCACEDGDATGHGALAVSRHENPP